MENQTSAQLTALEASDSFKGYYPIEKFLKKGEQPPVAPGYFIRINSIVFPFEGTTLSPREVMERMYIEPPEDHVVRLDFVDRPSVEPDLDERFSLRLVGLESLAVRERYVDYAEC